MHLYILSITCLGRVNVKYFIGFILAKIMVFMRFIGIEIGTESQIKDAASR